MTRRLGLCVVLVVSVAGGGVLLHGQKPKSTPASTPSPLSKSATLTIEGGQFRFQNHPIQILSGEMHYPRVPREYWRDRFRKARAMGLNTITTYVFWNLHEPKPGVFDFSGNLDVAAYIKMAGDEGLHVIVRPGPYVCSEWDLGGLPAWLLADRTMVLRSTDARFMAASARYLDRLGKELAPLQSTHGGPIIAVQVENEYGSFDHDHDYMTQIKDQIVHAGLGEVLLYTADGPGQLEAGTLPDLPAVVNFGPGGAEKAFAALHAFRPNQPLMSGEYWAGWFDQWGRPHARTNGDQQARELDWMLSQNGSFSLYMFHGGTSFGFMNGANLDGTYRPQTSSYDYDAALDESGRPRPKFFSFRDAIAKHFPGVTFPELPVTPAPIAIASTTLDEAAPLWSMLGHAVHADRPKTMEELGQSYGYVLYRTKLPVAPSSVTGDLVLTELHDYAEVFVNQRLVATLDRRLNQNRASITLPGGDATLDILVENTGRINFKKDLRAERKGITESVTLNGRELMGWEMFPLPMTDTAAGRFARTPTDGPAFYRGHLEVATPGDTFLDLRGWTKGAVWVNGHALGRFWNIGPQQTLYLPGPWLHKGSNDVVVFDLSGRGARTIAGVDAPILASLGEAGIDRR